MTDLNEEPSSPESMFEGLISGWTSQEVTLAFAAFVLVIALISYLVLTLYRCCCSRNYAEWRSAWSVYIKSTFSRKNLMSVRRKRRSLSDTLFDAAPIRLKANDEEEIEEITATLESPFVSSYSMTGDIIIWDVLSGECHTKIRRNHLIGSDSCLLNRSQNSQPPITPDAGKNEDPETSGFVPKHKQTDSGSSDSTFTASVSSNGSHESINQRPGGDYQIRTTTREPVTPHVTNHHHQTAGHRRHHSLGSIHPRHQVSVDHKREEDYSFVPFYSQKNWSSREVLTDLFRSACSSGCSSSTAVHPVQGNNSGHIHNHHQLHSPAVNTLVGFSSKF